MVHGSTEADPVCQPRQVVDKRTPLDTTRAAHVETTRLPSGHTNTVTTRTSERLPTPVHGYWGRQPHNGHGRYQKDEDEGDEGEILTTTRRGVGTTTTNERGGDGSGTTEANGEGTTSAAILARRRDAAGATLGDAEARTKTMTGLRHYAEARTTNENGLTEGRTPRRAKPGTTRGRRRRRPGPMRRRRWQPAAAAQRRGRRGTRCCESDDGGGAVRRRAGRTMGRRSARTNGEDDDGHRRCSGGGEVRPRATLPLRCRRWRRRRRPVDWHGGRGCRSGCRRDRGRGGAGDSVPAKQRSSRRRGRRCDIDGGDGDVGRRTGDAAEAAGGRTVATTPLLPAGAHLRGSPRETEGRPGERRLLRCRGRRRHSRLARGRGGRGGWRRSARGKEKGDGGEG
uniref:Uncharacterized protein n=1 Tax=Oryza sativa subsp. japonica TaxID=39947 RepID=Q5WMS5_ORYSJ|nr:hypothetical protein [Oryza sativa Japonica Group]